MAAKVPASRSPTAKRSNSAGLGQFLAIMTPPRLPHGVPSSYRDAVTGRFLVDNRARLRHTDTRLPAPPPIRPPIRIRGSIAMTDVQPNPGSDAARSSSTGTARSLLDRAKAREPAA